MNVYKMNSAGLDSCSLQYLRKEGATLEKFILELDYGYWTAGMLFRLILIIREQIGRRNFACHPP